MAGNTSNTGSWVPQVNTVGLRNVGSYQVSGTPYLTGAANFGGAGVDGELRFEFPYVTKRVVVYHAHSNTSNKRIRVTFEATGSISGGQNYVELPSSHSHFDANVKCTEIYVHKRVAAQSVTSLIVYAELTNIPASRMYDLTGSGISE
tara:strand:+ start:4420 stop:4863 length:444 start_codon:yes stop_codon:yes gene_type:complete